MMTFKSFCLIYTSIFVKVLDSGLPDFFFFQCVNTFKHKNCFSLAISLVLAREKDIYFI